jgi:histidinol-phosphatase (PHP family)
LGRARRHGGDFLKVATSRGRGIEVNTSGWCYGLGDPQPTEDVLGLYRDLGGTIVTIGSDSHKPSHLGSYLRVAKDLLRSVVFECFCTYALMEPRFHEL